MKKIILILTSILLWALPVGAQSVLNLQEAEDGRYTIETSVNGVGIKTFYTEENWFVSMSSTTYLFLYENGYISDSDVKGLAALKMPDGSSTKAASFVIRELRFGKGIIVKDIPAFVIKKQTVPLLIGSSTFESLGDVTRDGNRIIIGDVSTASKELADPVDSLSLAAQQALDAKKYETAADCFSKLEAAGSLNMLTQYQYAMVLGLTGDDVKNLSVSSSWLADNEGKTLTMDYWILNGLGKSCSRMKDSQGAIGYYKKAVEAYCKLFNTSTKDIKKGDFHDETLGATLFSLGVTYAAEGKVADAEVWCALAAECGNSSAEEFCQKYRIKY